MKKEERDDMILLYQKFLPRVQLTGAEVKEYSYMSSLFSKFVSTLDNYEAMKSRLDEINEEYHKT